MNKILIRLVMAAPALLSACASAPPKPATGAAQTLAAAERAFAQDASTRTVNEAFLAVLADDATLFRPLAVNGRQALAERAMPATLDLQWTPVHAEVSADGTLGFTTGPATVGTRGAAPEGMSWFVSVWQRVGNEWKLRTDAGIEIPTIVSLQDAARNLTTSQSARRFKAHGLLQAEQRVAANYATQFGRAAAEDVLVLRSGTVPTASRANGLNLISHDSAAIYAPMKTEIAASGDLGFVYGVINPASPKPRAYERIYRRDRNGEWRIAVDWRN